MQSHKSLMTWAAAASLAFTFGCGGNSKVPPKEPKKEPVIDATPDIPEPKPLETGLIITAVPDVEIMINGEKRGKTPIEVEVSPGEHEVVFLFEGDNKTTLTVSLSEGEFKKVHQAISPDASDARMGD